MAKNNALLFLLFCWLNNFSQTEIMLNNELDNHYIIKQSYYSDYQHTAFKPLVHLSKNEFTILDSIVTNKGIKSYNNKYIKWLRNSNFISHNDSTLILSANPYINQSFSKNEENTYWFNGRGVVFTGKLSDRFCFISGVVENQAVFPEYIKKYISEKRVVPGMGRSKVFKETGRDFAYSFGHVLWMPLKHLSIQAGHGKHFIGEGYRSLLLSDMGFYSPFIRFTATYKNIQYTSVFTSFQDVSKSDTRLLAYQRSHATYNYLNISLPGKIQIGLLESIIWKTTFEDKNNVFPTSFFLPIIGPRTIMYGFNHHHNVLAGINISWLAHKQIMFYGQTIIDDLSAFHNNDSLKFRDRYGYQLGFRLIEPLNIENLFLLTEVNRIRPYTYSHTERKQSYNRFNEPIAHPLGANFREIVFRGLYHYNGIFIQGSYSQYFTGKDEKGAFFGSNISQSDTLASFNDNRYNGNIFQGIGTEVSHMQIEIGYLINPVYNLRISAGIHNRKQIVNNNELNENFIFIKFSTMIQNFYNDF